LENEEGAKMNRYDRDMYRQGRDHDAHGWPSRPSSTDRHQEGESVARDEDRGWGRDMRGGGDFGGYGYGGAMAPSWREGFDPRFREEGRDDSPALRERLERVGERIFGDDDRESRRMHFDDRERRDRWERGHHGLASERGRRHGPHDEPSLWERVKGVFSGRGPKNYVRSDDRIKEDVCERLCYDPYVDATDVEVHVRDGEVTLTGHVDDRAAKRRMDDLLEGVRGVHDIHNQVRLRRREVSPSAIGQTQTPGTTAGLTGSTTTHGVSANRR
jgi:hypothetical protein